MLSIINIAGLSLGLACSLLIVFHVKEELSYDKFYPKADRIYRVTNERREVDHERHWAVTAPLMAPEIRDYFPEIEATARLRQVETQVLSYQPEVGEPKRFEESLGFFADQSTIEVFDLQFLEGSTESALTAPNSIVITSSMAHKYFGCEIPVGKFLALAEDDLPLQVTGVIEDVPFNTHMYFEYLVSYPTFVDLLKSVSLEDLLNNRNWACLNTYVLLNDNVSQADVEAKLSDFMLYFLAGYGQEELLLSHVIYHLQPITNIHLHSNLEQEIVPNSDIAYVYMFSIVAFLVLLIAAVNYINISTAQALKRMREVGVRKVFGAQKSQLLWQFLGESFLSTIIAAFIAFSLVEVCIPFYNMLSGRHLSAMQILTPDNLIIAIAAIIVVGLLSGIYPAFFISNFRPIVSLKGEKNTQSSVVVLRKTLIVLQFAISVFLIFCTIIIYRQMVYFHNRDLGYDQENVVAVRLYNVFQDDPRNITESLKNCFLTHPDVANVSVVSELPGSRFSVEPLIPDNKPDGVELRQLRMLRADKEIIETLNIEIIEGNSFAELSPTSTAFIINQPAAKALHLEKPIGQRASTYFDTNGEIVGVISDFHYASLKNVIEPMAIEYIPEGEYPIPWAAHMLVKIQGNDIAGVLNFLETEMKRIAPDNLFVYFFLDDRIQQLYMYEDRMNDIFTVFALFAIAISCLGLLGLASFAAEQRTKEIGIRKALGATIMNIVQLLSKEFILLVVVANLIALPVGYYTMRLWLQNFAYRIDVDWTAFVLAGILTLALALATVGFRGIKAAVANPINALRYE